MTYRADARGRAIVASAEATEEGQISFNGRFVTLSS